MQSGLKIHQRLKYASCLHLVLRRCRQHLTPKHVGYSQLSAGWSGVRVPAYFLFQKRRDLLCGPPQPPTHWIPRSFPGLTWPLLKVGHSLHLGSGLRMSGAISLRPLYAFMVWTGTTLPFLTFFRKIGEFLLDYTKPRSSRTDLFFVCVAKP